VTETACVKDAPPDAPITDGRERRPLPPVKRFLPPTANPSAKARHHLKKWQKKRHGMTYVKGSLPAFNSVLRRKYLFNQNKNNSNV
jgi:hypothetical protein